MSPADIKSISPAKASVGEKVTIEGIEGSSDFTHADVVNFGNTGTPNIRIIDKTHIEATVPDMNVGTVEVIVNIPGEVLGTPCSFEVTPKVKKEILNTITLQNNSGLDSSKYTLWVAGYFTEKISDKVSQYLFLNDSGKFTTSSGVQKATFIEIEGNQSKTIYVPDKVSTGNNRLVFTITNKDTVPAALSPENGYTAYPFPADGGASVPPPGPYDIFEFGPNAQYDTSAVDSFGINLSFTVSGENVPNPNLIYGTNPAVTRRQIGDAFAEFVKDHPGYGQLLYTSPIVSRVGDQYSAIVSPKNWLAVHKGKDAGGLANYWDDTIQAFFAKGNQLNFYLNAATVGNYAGTSDGEKYTLTGPGGIQVVIPASDFAGDQGFIQAVPGPPAKDDKDTKEEAEAKEKLYQIFGQIEAAFFQAISRGVALDGVVPAEKSITENYSSDAWINTANWYTDHLNSYNNKPSVYDVYAKFFHHGMFLDSDQVQKNIFAVNSNGTFGMAYGFSLDENPNVGHWPKSNNVPSKTDYNVGADQNVTLVIGPWE